MENCKAKQALPDFDKPPVNEVVFGIQFESINEFLSPHLGLLWHKLNRKQYPRCQEVQLLAHITEESSGAKQAEFIDLPLLPRVFFVNQGGDMLVQVQKDRFLRNWRKMSPDDPYPRYKKLLPEFIKSLELFNEFVSEEFSGRRLNIDQYELTYVNHIYIDDERLSQDKLSKLFSVFSCNFDSSFLPIPESLGWNWSYNLPNTWGRLHVSVSQAHNAKGKPLFVLNLTARGINENKDMISWLDVAHEWIVRGFANITNKEAQENIWRKK